MPLALDIALLTTFLDAAKQHLGKDGKLMPTMFVAGKQPVMLGIDVDLPSAELRQIAFGMYGAAYAQKHGVPDLIITTNDVYYLQTKDLSNRPTGSFADRPDAREALQVLGLAADGSMLGLLCPYERTATLEHGTTITFAATEEQRGDLFPYLQEAFWKGVEVMTKQRIPAAHVTAKPLPSISNTPRI